MKKKKKARYKLFRQITLDLAEVRPLYRDCLNCRLNKPRIKCLFCEQPLPEGAGLEDNWHEPDCLWLDAQRVKHAEDRRRGRKEDLPATSTE